MTADSLRAAIKTAYLCWFCAGLNFLVKKTPAYISTSRYLYRISIKPETALMMATTKAAQNMRLIPPFGIIVWFHAAVTAKSGCVTRPPIPARRCRR